mmetsp:Transcript_41296/g.74448  ORF Transcript_41296/g.74448 Transcript_41296/m.74448 type:complete len:382 (-) Transcript_41296:15-1160(-)|eukprot:CAMPEP_0201931592 /NCGR_PEP_ID=MMETSP0903-20130614/27699_1 /ASSEMBLY_ACC=CAM_ASM_000552 /TAXON_ID=420261 /ORGANISM="Thalassiosira antarctica, Strain CCMP982" /LENGTH=381 /DNA_ID=CAMNT_0048470973 /DNA_START=51 /DNA_END=1196 /DNA_ORIENTATION=+
MHLSNGIALSLLLSIHHTVTVVHSLSIVTESSRAQTARSRLTEAFRSPSKKLTLHPELVLPEPSDPTALLLRASEVTKLSQTIRTRAKANAIFVEGSVDALTPMGKEQDDARGNFPGPLPIIYSLVDEDSLSSSLEQLQSVDGVEGVMVPFFGGKQIESVERYLEEATNHPSLTDGCSAIWEAGLQPIPEIVLAPGSVWPEEDVVRLVDAVKDTCGGLDPVSIVFTNGEAAENEASSDNDEEEDDEPSTPKITIPTSISKRLTFVGSIRTTAGEGRMNFATSQLSSCNFNGAFLRADCVPGYRLNPDLNVVGGFWSAAVGDLKSLKSKNFSFRSKVKLEKDVPMEWYNYQKDIMDSGALGGASHNGGGAPVDSDSGDYKGF